MQYERMHSDSVLSAANATDSSTSATASITAVIGESKIKTSYLAGYGAIFRMDIASSSSQHAMREGLLSQPMASFLPFQSGFVDDIDEEAKQFANQSQND